MKKPRLQRPVRVVVNADDLAEASSAWDSHYSFRRSADLAIYDAVCSKYGSRTGALIGKRVKVRVVHQRGSRRQAHFFPARETFPN